MKPHKIPYLNTQVSCACGNTFSTRSTVAPQIKTEICANCHPFYTGQHRKAESALPIAKFQAKYANFLGRK